MSFAWYLLGAFSSGQACPVDDERISAIELEIGAELPDPIKSLYMEYRSSVMFNKDVRFVPLERSGVERDDGSLDLNLIYGPCENDDSVVNMTSTFSDMIPGAPLVIGESSGGNQICLDRNTGQVLFWHHEAVTDDTSSYVIAETVSDFLGSLYTVEEEKPLLKKGDVLKSDIRF